MNIRGVRCNQIVNCFSCVFAFAKYLKNAINCLVVSRVRTKTTWSTQLARLIQNVLFRCRVRITAVWFWKSSKFSRVIQIIVVKEKKPNDQRYFIFLSRWYLILSQPLNQCLLYMFVGFLCKRIKKKIHNNIAYICVLFFFFLTANKMFLLLCKIRLPETYD